MKITVSDEDLRDAVVMQLTLTSVNSDISQRPSADNVILEMTMKSLNISGLQQQGKWPIIVKSRNVGTKDKLLNFVFENNPPCDSNGDLELDEGSVYDQRVNIFSSPLEIVYDKKTFQRLSVLFKAPDEVNLANLQQQAFAKLKEYKESTALSLQYVIDHHNLVDVDIKLMSSVVVIPMDGRFSENSACAVINLGSIAVSSKPISQQTRDLRELSLSDLTETFKKSLRDQAYDKFNVCMENMQMLVALPNEDWRREVNVKSSPLFLLKPTTVQVTLQYCLVKNDPELPVCKINGKLDNIAVRISDYRLNKLAQILDSLVEPDDGDPHGGNLHRADSNESMQSALSSLANTGSLIANINPSNIGLAKLAPRRDDSDAVDDPMASIQLTKLTVDFEIETVNLSISQQSKSKTSNKDEKIFHFVLDRLSASTSVRTFDLTGKFDVGGISCTHLLVLTPSGEPVKILATKDQASALSIVYTDVKKSSPDLYTVHKGILKNVDVNFTSVDITIHQNAIMDLVEKVNKFIDEVSKNAKNLMKEIPEQAQHHSQQQRPPSSLDEAGPRTPVLRRKDTRKLSRRISFQTTAKIGSWSARAKLRASKSTETKEEPIDVKVNAALESVTFHLMTTKVKLAEMRVEDLRSTFIQTKACKEITAKLVNFEVLDGNAQESGTNYFKIAESQDQKVFDAKVLLYEHTPEAKAANIDLVDVSVDASMGRIRLVFLMKFVNDILAFIDPFSATKEMVAEKANDALEEATKSMIDAYANSTRAKLNIQMDAPVIIIPINSRSKVTFLADLGTLNLSNRFSIKDGLIYDEMHFTLSNLKLNRAKIDEDVMSNKIVAQCPIIKPITFELDIKRNMAGAKTKTDPAELTVTGQLYQVKYIYLLEHVANSSGIRTRSKFLLASLRVLDRVFHLQSSTDLHVSSWIRLDSPSSSARLYPPTTMNRDPSEVTMARWSSRPTGMSGPLIHSPSASVHSSVMS